MFSLMCVCKNIFQNKQSTRYTYTIQSCNGMYVVQNIWILTISLGTCASIHLFRGRFYPSIHLSVELFIDPCICTLSFCLLVIGLASLTSLFCRILLGIARKAPLSPALDLPSTTQRFRVWGSGMMRVRLSKGAMHRVGTPLYHRLKCEHARGGRHERSSPGPLRVRQLVNHFLLQFSDLVLVRGQSRPDQRLTSLVSGSLRSELLAVRTFPTDACGRSHQVRWSVRVP
jgi:hypothetical protein